MTEGSEKTEVKKRGNPNFGKPKSEWEPAKGRTTNVTNVSENKATGGGQVYSDSIVWTMLMQAAIQTWDAKTEMEVHKAAAVADLGLIQYRKRF